MLLFPEQDNPFNFERNLTDGCKAVMAPVAGLQLIGFGDMEIQQTPRMEFHPLISQDSELMANGPQGTWRIRYMVNMTVDIYSYLTEGYHPLAILAYWRRRVIGPEKALQMPHAQILSVQSGPALTESAGEENLHLHVQANFTLTFSLKPTEILPINP